MTTPTPVDEGTPQRCGVKYKPRQPENATRVVECGLAKGHHGLHRESEDGPGWYERPFMAVDGFEALVAEVSRLRSELATAHAERDEAREYRDTAYRALHEVERNLQNALDADGKGWREVADEALAHNVADVFENGPRLAWGRRTAPIAIDRQNRRVLQTGLGVLGVGTMWIGYDDEPAEWADLPERDSAVHGEEA